MKSLKTQIALVDDHALFRSGIANLLIEFNDITVAFEAKNGRELQQILPNHPNVEVILMDINMPIMDGYVATAWLKGKYPSIHVLALSMFDDDAAVINMLRAGAGGYVLKESKPVDLYKAINDIKANGIYINELVSGKMLHSLQRNEASVSNSVVLTDREKEFLQWCASELPYKEIAAKMGIASRSIENYREALFNKLELKSRVGLAMYAIKHGLVKL